MRRSFTVTSPAPDLSLLSIGQLRVIAGLPANDSSRDDELNALGGQLSTDIAVACGVAADGSNTPTLLAETCTEVFWHAHRSETELFLARRFIGSVSSLTEAGNVLPGDDFIVDREAGMISRLSTDLPWYWANGLLTVVYVAGFAAAPPDLVGIATDLARLRLSAASVDPLEKSTTIEIPDVETYRVDRWVGAAPGSTAGPVPADILARLSRYRNVVVA